MATDIASCKASVKCLPQPKHPGYKKKLQPRTKKGHIEKDVK